MKQHVTSLKKKKRKMSYDFLGISSSPLHIVIYVCRFKQKGGDTQQLHCKHRILCTAGDRESHRAEFDSEPESELSAFGGGIRGGGGFQLRDHSVRGHPVVGCPWRKDW